MFQNFFFSFQQISSIGWDLHYLTVLLNFSEGKGRNRAKRRPLLLDCEYASMLTIYRMTCTSQRAGTEEGTCPVWETWMGTEPASSRRLHCSPCFCEAWTLTTNVSISVDPGAWIQCENTYPYAVFNLPLASTFCISYFHFNRVVCLSESATLLSDPAWQVLSSTSCLLLQRMCQYCQRGRSRWEHSSHSSKVIDLLPKFR